MTRIDDTLDKAAVAKQPKQERARARVQRVLDAAEELLLEAGLNGFSIPVLAQRLGAVRGSIYSDFATPNALFNELATRYLAQVLVLFSGSKHLSAMPWREGIATGVRIAADYYDKNPVARLLILGGAVTDTSFRAQELTIKRIGELGRVAWQARGIHLPSQPDVAALAIDLGMSCFRRSVFEHGSITPAYREMATRVMCSFLEPYVEPSVDPQPSAAGTKPRAAKKT
jgi:AcrR family transcriptional regulator